MGMVVKQPYSLVSKLKKIKTKFLRCTGYLNSIKNPIKHDLLLILVLVRQQNFLNCYPRVLQLLKNMLSSIVKKYMRDLVKVSKGCKDQESIQSSTTPDPGYQNLFWSIKNSGEILDKLKARDFNATSLSTYDFSTLYTTLPHNLIKDKLIDFIERTFQREGSPYLAYNDRNAFLLQKNLKNIMHGRVKMYVMR